MSDRKAMQASQVRQISNFWVRVVGKPAATPNKVGIIKSDSPKGYLFYGASSEDVAPLFGAALGGQPLQVGVRFAGEDIDRIYSGIVKDTGEDFAEVSRCIDELIAAMSKDVETVPAKGK